MQIPNSEAKSKWGRTQDEAKLLGVCVRCGNTPGKMNGYEAREYHLHALCPPCYEATASEAVRRPYWTDALL